MPTVVQFRRGTTAQNNSFTGAAGEISIDTDLDVVRVHDGTTAGGFAQVGLDSSQTITNKVYQGTSTSVTGNVTGGNLITAGAVTASTVSTTGNITGNYILGNGSLLTGIDATSIQNGTSSVAVIASGGNVRTNIAGATIATTHSGGVAVTGVVSATGNITGGNLSVTSISGTLTTAAQTNITSVGTLGSLTVTANVAGGNLTTAGQISATGNITGGNLSILGDTVMTGNLTVNGTTTTINSNTVTTNDLLVNMANNAATAAAANGGGIAVGPAGNAYASVTYNSTANIWTLSNGANTPGIFSATGNITGGNLLTSGAVSATSTVTGSQFNGSGAGLTSIPAANVTGTLSVNTTGYAATVSSAAQPNITSVGTLSSLAVTGNITGGNLSGTSIVGTLTTASQTNITSVGTLGSLSVTGNVNAGNVIATHYGSGAGLSSITGANVTGTVASATTAGTVTTAAQPNITSVGTLSSVTVSGGITVNSSAGATAITNGATNGVGNIGSSTVYFNTVFAKATSAQYADLAENYLADAVYEPGTVVSFGGKKEVTMSLETADRKVAGVVSTDPAHLMNTRLTGENVVALALIGRVPTKVVGPVTKGDFMISGGNGHAVACATPSIGTVIGKAIEDFDGDLGMIEILINNQ